MAQTVQITDAGPLLDGVFGSLSSHDEQKIRSIVLTCGDRLDAVAKFVDGRVGCHGSGMELHWLPSGQTSIWGNVAATADHGAVDFVVELVPGWARRERTDSPHWTVEVTIEVDCHHESGHGRHVALNETWPAASPDEAVVALELGVTRLADLARLPLDRWIDLGGS